MHTTLSNSIRLLLTISVAVLIGSSAVALAADQSEKTVDFERDVSPIFAARCMECHGDDEPEGGLRLTSRKNALVRGDSGEWTIVPGKSAKSELLRRITAKGDEQMPPDEEPLTEEQIATIQKWIDAGAEWPQTNAGPRHWAYVRPQRPPLPNIERTAWVQNPIDVFVLAKLEAHDPALGPSRSADPAKLLRRVYLDLIGLPPSVEEVDAYLADPSQVRFEKIVDELLMSPQYGEKWARQWLDLARYADSNGFQADQFRSIWAYRDWVIGAMNDDMPFDQFTIEQLAGDLLPDATLAQQMATGFQRCTTCNVEAGVDPEENRVNQIIDRVNTFGTVWLGTTLECAQCHNHKYDPFTQQDYYQLFAFFNNTPIEVEQIGGKGVSYEVAGPKVKLPLAESLQQQRAELEQRKAQFNKKLAQRKAELNQTRAAWEESLRSSLDSTPQWHDVEIQSFDSIGSATFERLDDRSLLVTGDVPDKDTYTVTIDTDLAAITGIKIETLTHESLPQQGPGRASPRPNMLINEIDLYATSNTDGKQELVGLHSATADFSQKNWDVAGAIDGDPKSAWGINPQFGKDHWASFLTQGPTGDENGTTLTLKLHQNYGGGRTIGRLRVSLMTGDPGAAALPDDVREILAVEPPERSDAQAIRLAEYQLETDGETTRLQKAVANLTKNLNAIQPDTTPVMVEMETPRETMIFKRGNFLDPLANVEPRTPGVLHAFGSDVPEGSSANRLSLARWVVSDENPLIGRVTVNRWWAEIFGQGLVKTLEDFGTQGEPTIHPELLDWLAVEFVENGWSMKHIHRLIVTSATYQQDSTVSDRLLEIDPDNSLLARGSRFRLGAEAIRDNALAISGLLSPKVGGPPVYPPQPPSIWRHVGRNAPKYETDEDEDRFRRGIYVVWRRSAPYPSFVNFDAPDRGACVVNRSRTNTPLQALTLLNDPAYVEMARSLAERMATGDENLSDRERVMHGFRLCTSRYPSSDEVTTLLTLFEQERARFKANPKAAAKLIQDAPKDADVSRLAAWFFVANVLLNLDETVTKG